MKDLTFSKSTDISEVRKDIIEKFHSLIKVELYEETILETEHLNELREIESFLQVLSNYMKIATKQENVIEIFTPLVKYAYLIKSKITSDKYFDDSPAPTETDYQHSADIVKTFLIDSEFIVIINKATDISELNNITILLIDLQFLIRTARDENCWTTFKLYMEKFASR